MMNLKPQNHHKFATVLTCKIVSFKYKFTQIIPFNKRFIYISSLSFFLITTRWRAIKTPLTITNERLATT